MQNLKILNKKEIKRILNQIEEQYDIDELDLDYVFLQNNEGRIFLVNRDIGKVDIEKLRINSLGLYFGKIERDEVRLSIEGSQLVGGVAKKNVVGINKEQANSWLQGNDVKVDDKVDGFAILKYGNDFLGAGRYKEGNVINAVPKERRIKLVI